MRTLTVPGDVFPHGHDVVDDDGDDDNNDTTTERYDDDDDNDNRVYADHYDKATDPSDSENHHGDDNYVVFHNCIDDGKSRIFLLFESFPYGNIFKCYLLPL